MELHLAIATDSDSIYQFENLGILMSIVLYLYFTTRYSAGTFYAKRITTFEGHSYQNLVHALSDSIVFVRFSKTIAFQFYEIVACSLSI